MEKTLQNLRTRSKSAKLIKFFGIYKLSIGKSPIQTKLEKLKQLEPINWMKSDEIILRS